MKIRVYKDDASLWDKFREGDKEAYAQIFEKYVRILFMYGSQFTNERELVKDCIQDVFIKMYLHRTTLKPTNNIKYYLFGALRNCIINSLRQERNHLMSVDNGQVKNTDNEDPSCKIEIQEDEVRMQGKVSQIMSSLTSRQRQAVHYRYIDNLSITEISDIMNMSYQAVLNTIQRALKRIRTNSLN